MTSLNWLIVFSLFFAQLCYSFYPIVSFSTCVDIGGKYVGTVAGIKNFFGQVGAFLLAMVFGKMADLTHNFNVPLLVVAVVVFLGSICWFFVDASRPVIMEISVGNEEIEN
jgi:nitrate/nitrite transporter NarK